MKLAGRFYGTLTYMSKDQENFTSHVMTPLKVLCPPYTLL